VIPHKVRVGVPASLQACKPASLQACKPASLQACEAVSVARADLDTYIYWYDCERVHLRIEVRMPEQSS
jgi:hypothetical protein